MKLFIHKSQTLLVEYATVWINMIVIAIMLSIIVVGTIRYDANNQALTTETIEHTIEKYMITCYATEGSYPPNLEYLQDHYGLILDEARYRYDYEVFASNVLPSITVFERQISKKVNHEFTIE